MSLSQSYRASSPSRSLSYALDDLNISTNSWKNFSDPVLRFKSRYSPNLRAALGASDRIQQRVEKVIEGKSPRKLVSVKFKWIYLPFVFWSQDFSSPYWILHSEIWGYSDIKWLGFLVLFSHSTSLHPRGWITEKLMLGLAVFLTGIKSGGIRSTSTHFMPDNLEISIDLSIGPVCRFLRKPDKFWGLLMDKSDELSFKGWGVTLLLPCSGHQGIPTAILFDAQNILMPRAFSPS